MVLHDLVLKRLESLLRKPFLREQKKGAKRRIDQMLHSRGAKNLKYKLLSLYLSIRCCTCTLASIKMKSYKIKIKQEGKCTSRESWIKIELNNDVMLKGELISVIELSLPSIGIWEFLGKWSTLQGALFLEHNLDLQ